MLRSKAKMTLTDEFPSTWTASKIDLLKLDSLWNNSKRFDHKFLLSRDNFLEFSNKSSNGFSLLTIDGQNQFTYQTEYFDTDDLELYFDHARRRKRRYKVRIRNYKETKRTRLEVKAHLGNSQTQKFVMEDVTSLGDQACNFIGQVFGAVHPGQRLHHFAESFSTVAKTQFERMTFVNEQNHEKVTIDVNLSLTANGQRFDLPENMFLVEVKTRSPNSNFLREMRKSRFEQTQFSKYCAAIELANEFRPRVTKRKDLEKLFPNNF
jgi:hypothetical protein